MWNRCCCDGKTQQTAEAQPSYLEVLWLTKPQQWFYIVGKDGRKCEGGGGSTGRGVGVVVVHTLCSLRFFAVFGLAARGGESLSLSLSLSISLPHAVKTPAVISVNPSSGALVNHSTSEE